MHIQIFNPVKEYFEREFKTQFNNLIITIELPSRQIKDSRYLETSTDSQVGILSCFSKSLENTCERVHFWRCCRP